jgi:hypothetical protein
MDWGFFRRVWVRGRRRGSSITFNSTYSYCHIFRSVTIDGFWIGFWIYWHDLELQVITAPQLVSTLYSSLQHTLSLFQPGDLTSRSLATTSNCGDSSASPSQLLNWVDLSWIPPYNEARGRNAWGENPIIKKSDGNLVLQNIRKLASGKDNRPTRNSTSLLRHPTTINTNNFWKSLHNIIITLTTYTTKYYTNNDCSSLAKHFNISCKVLKFY